MSLSATSDGLRNSRTPLHPVIRKSVTTLSLRSSRRDVPIPENTQQPPSHDGQPLPVHGLCLACLHFVIPSHVSSELQLDTG